MIPSSNRTLTGLVAAVVVVASTIVGSATTQALTSTYSFRDYSRILDTRAAGETFDGLFEGIGRVPGGSAVEVDVASRFGGFRIDQAPAIVVNVTAINPAAPGFVTVYPCGSVPNTSSINFSLSGGVTANEIVATLSQDGTLCIFSSVAVDLALDVSALVIANSALTPLPPARVLDTRPTGSTVDGLFEGDGRVSAGGVLALDVLGRGDVPNSGVGSVVINVAAVNPAADGFVTAYPCGDVPNASSLNFAAGTVVSNEIVAPVSNGQVCFFSSAATDLIVDVAGHVEANAPGVTPLTPRRMADTRPAPAGQTIDGASEGSGKVTAGGLLEIEMAGRAGVATDAVAVIMNVTAAAPDSGGFVTVYTCDDVPLTSTLNFAATGGPVANEVLAPLSADGTVCLRVSASVHLIVDVVASVRF